MLYVSVVTSWEISNEKGLGKLDAPAGLETIVEDEGFEPLPIAFFHGEPAGELPLVRCDPFDRMLVAQAQAEGLEIVTVDESVPVYGVKTVDARLWSSGGIQ